MSSFTTRTKEGGGYSGPTGQAGGDLSGTYPNPSVVDDSHNHSIITLTEWPHYKIHFNKTSAPSLFLRPMLIGESIREIVVQIVEAFDVGVQLSVGFPADTQEIAKPNRIIAHLKGNMYKFQPYRLSAINESLTLYFSGTTPTKGSGIVFINMYDKTVV